MRKLLFFTIAALFATVLPTMGQDPQGLYRLQKFIYEDGRENITHMSQYKYAADSVGLLVFYRNMGNTFQWNTMGVEIREPHRLAYTGEKPQGADGHGIQIFNVSDKEFYFKWYNDKWPNMSNLNEFIIEVYDKNGFEDEVSRAFSMFEGKSMTGDNKLYGWWIRTAATTTNNPQLQLPTIWKAYSPEMSMVLNIQNNGLYLNCSLTKTVTYDNDTTIHEVGHVCDIKWLNDNCHTLTYMEGNTPITETWVRSGLPLMWQKIFHTNIDTYKNGIDCIHEAIVAADKGDMVGAEALFSEAMDKKVNIIPLCGVLSTIESKLLTEKKNRECIDFFEKQSKAIELYANATTQPFSGEARFYNFQTKIAHAIAIYRNGDKEVGTKLLEEQLSIIDSEIERYKAVSNTEVYINALYSCKILAYYWAYDIFGTERTLLQLDAVELMAPGTATAPQMKNMIMECRGNCYLLNGNKEEAHKLWKMIKDMNPDFFKNGEGRPLKEAFGE